LLKNFILNFQVFAQKLSNQTYPFPLNPIVTIDKTVVAPNPVLAGISVPFSVLTNQNVTQEQQTIKVSGM